MFLYFRELEAERDAQKESGIAAPMYGGKCRHLTADEVAEKKRGEPYTIRMRVPENVTYNFTDLVRGDVTLNQKMLVTGYL